MLAVPLGPTLKTLVGYSDATPKPPARPIGLLLALTKAS